MKIDLGVISLYFKSTYLYIFMVMFSMTARWSLLYMIEKQCLMYFCLEFVDK